MMRKELQDRALSFDHERQRSAVILVDDKGYYLGDWRTIDVEGVRQVVMSLNNCLMWFESNLHIQLISCFAQKTLTITQISNEIRSLLDMKISESAPAQELPPKMLQFAHDYLVKVFKLEKGSHTSFEAFAMAMERFGIDNFKQILSWLRSLLKSELFDHSGMLIENRPLIFNQLEILVKLLSEAFGEIRQYVDSLDIAFQIKTEVFGFKPQFLSHRTDIEEIRSKMGNYSYLTVNQIDQEGRPIPIGVIHSHQLQKEHLGTVTLRDFCNREAMKIPSYLQIIRVIDHHKATLITDSPTSASVSDVQSSNTLVAQKAFIINDQYRTGGLSLTDIEEQLKELHQSPSTMKNLRLTQRLLQKKGVLQRGSSFRVHPQRELIEYLHFVYAILDDTDLLTKVSRQDVECMASLLNRMKTLTTKQEREIVDFDDIPEDQAFTSKAAKRLLQNPDFYSLYSKVYAHKEQGVDENIEKACRGEPSSVFTDVKILNYCNRVGQTKIFASNYPCFSRSSQILRKLWYEKALNIYANNREIMLHLHALSTVASAEELFKGGEISYQHKDELWFWIPQTELAVEKLKLFLSGFKGSKAAANLSFELELIGENGKELSQIFSESFLPVPHIFARPISELPLAILRYDAGGLNSRKAMIAPYLPRLDQ